MDMRPPVEGEDVGYLIVIMACMWVGVLYYILSAFFEFDELNSFLICVLIFIISFIGWVLYMRRQERLKDAAAHPRPAVEKRKDGKRTQKVD